MVGRLNSARPHRSIVPHSDSFRRVGRPSFQSLAANARERLKAGIARDPASSAPTRRRMISTWFRSPGRPSTSPGDIGVAFHTPRDPCFAAEELEAAQQLGAGFTDPKGYGGLIVGQDVADQLAGDHLQRKVDTPPQACRARRTVRGSDAQRRGEADSLREGAQGGAPARARGGRLQRRPGRRGPKDARQGPHRRASDQGAFDRSIRGSRSGPRSLRPTARRLPRMWLDPLRPPSGSNGPAGPGTSLLRPPCSGG